MTSNLVPFEWPNDRQLTETEADAYLDAVKRHAPANINRPATFTPKQAEVAGNSAPLLAEGGAIDWPDVSKEGSPRQTCANARAAILALEITCRYDRFHDRLLVGGKALAPLVGEFSDHACLMLRKLIDEQFRFDPGRNNAYDACVQLCLESSFDPIIEYLDGLKWDSRSRISEWLTVYMGAEDTAFNREVGKLMLVAMVRRAKQPGCKFDTIPVFEGPEGTNKSSLLLALAGAAENFSDQTIIGLGDREQQERLKGKWVYEIPDLSGMRKAEIEHTKAFASRTHDRGRPAYGRAPVDQPRRCIVVGTTNEEQYLKSRTGNRRFRPVLTGKIHLEAFARDRNQLLAEAPAVEAEGGPITLPKHLWGDAKAIQNERVEDEPWADLLANVRGAEFGGEERIASAELLRTHLNISPDRVTDIHSKRLGVAMRALGWTGPKVLKADHGKQAKAQRGFHRSIGGQE